MSFTQIPQEIMQALKIVDISNRQTRVLVCVIEKTIKWHEEFNRVQNVEIAEETGISEPNVSRLKKSLVSRNILIKKGRKIGVNLDTSSWLTKEQENLSKLTTQTCQNRQQKLVKNDNPLINNTNNNNNKLINESFLKNESAINWFNEQQFKNPLKFEEVARSFVEYNNGKAYEEKKIFSMFTGWVKRADLYFKKQTPPPVKAKPQPTPEELASYRLMSSSNAERIKQELAPSIN